MQERNPDGIHDKTYQFDVMLHHLGNDTTWEEKKKLDLNISISIPDSWYFFLCAVHFLNSFNGIELLLLLWVAIDAITLSCWLQLHDFHYSISMPIVHWIINFIGKTKLATTKKKLGKRKSMLLTCVYRWRKLDGSLYCYVIWYFSVT